MQRSKLSIRFVLALAVFVRLESSLRANDDQLIYSERLNNGWQDWGWATRNYANPSPVHSGSESIGVTIATPYYDGLQIYHPDVDTSLYTNLTFWINGGTNGGQLLQIYGMVNLNGTNNFGLSRISLPTPKTNAWQQVTIPLSVLGVANQTHFTGFVIQSRIGASQPTYYLDDISLVANPPPATVHVGVNAAQPGRTVDARLFGVNTAAWDGNLDTPATIFILTNMDNQALRWPGGSWGDEYHWTNEPNSAGFVNRNWGAFTTNFIHVATNTHAQVYMIANYGSSTAAEAAFGVRMCNVTNHAAFKYWEIGNENGGSWETDNNTNAPWQPHDPWTYAMRFKDYYTQMKAVDPTIKLGAVADITEDGTANYTNHPVVNPRTGVTHNGWTPVMLHTMLTNGVIPDFLIEHKYAPDSSDTYDLLWAGTWAADAASLRQMLVDYLGGANTNVELACTEHGNGGDRQRVSLVSGLFWADSIGQILQTEFNSRIWWDLRNGQSAITNSDNALYGWRTDANGYFYYDEGIVAGAGIEATNRYPAFYCGKLMKYFARGGDTVVAATNDYQRLSAYAVRRANGGLTLLVVNKSSAASLNAAVSLAGYQPFTNATIYSYGIPQDDAARTGSGSPDIAQTNLWVAGTGFNFAFAPYSASVISFLPAAPALLALPAPQSPPGQFVFQLQGQSGVPYVIQNSADLTGWNSVATNILSGSTLTVTNAVDPGRPGQFWRAVWQP